MTKRKCAPPPAPTGVVLQIHTTLMCDDKLSPMELANKLSCDLETAKQARAAFFKPYIEHRGNTK